MTPSQKSRARPNRSGDPGLFREIAELPELESHMEAFRKATGLPFLKIVPPEEKHSYIRSKADEGPLCALVRKSAQGLHACQENQCSLLQCAGKGTDPQYANCSIGLTEFAIPVMEGGRHVATLISGQIFLKKPTEREFLKLAERLQGKGKTWLREARKAFQNTPVIPRERLEAMIRLLNDFVRHLPEDARRHTLVSSTGEHRAVRSAKEFIESHAEGAISLEQVLAHVHVSRFHFCKIFKRSTGITLTEFVSRIRMEKARTLLLDGTKHVSEIAFASGFGSLSQFNSTFRKHAGMSPTAYRSMQRLGRGNLAAETRNNIA